MAAIEWWEDHDAILEDIEELDKASTAMKTYEVHEASPNCLDKTYTLATDGQLIYLDNRLGLSPGDTLAILTPVDAAAIQADRLDAERYRALRGMHWDDSDYAVARTTGIKLGADCPSGDRLDAIVDAIQKGGA